MRLPGHLTDSRIPIGRRLSLAAGIAVAAAVLLASVAAYFAVRSNMLGEIDSSLRDRAAGIQQFVAQGPQPDFGGSQAQEGPLRHIPVPPPGDPGAEFGGAEGVIQFVAPGGGVVAPASDAGPTLPVGAGTRALAAQGGETTIGDVTVSGQHLRILTAPLPVGGAVQVARPLNEVDSTLRSLLWILAAINVGGVIIAVFLGRAVSGASLAPVRDFTARTEEIAGAGMVGRRLPEEGDDELGRLARSYNATLEALEGSVAAQRLLVSDASHELRTPLASVRANAELMDREDISEAERRDLAHSVLEQAGELGLLIDDVVELARRGELPQHLADVRLDEVVEEAVARARAHAPGVEFTCHAEPIVVRGVADRLGRAVSNLLDNAAKWSPEGGLVEVRLAGGELSVRDHGRGFAEADLPHVFDRFYRADAARSLPGSGLGLAIVRQVVEAHGGTVSAGNAAGGGAVLRASFPGATAPGI